MLEGVKGFDWGSGNRNKNKDKHGVEWFECEEVFFNRPLLISPNPAHSQKEERFQALGQTNFGRPLFLAFTLRDKKIRVISARDQSRKERNIYAKAQK